MTSPLFTLFTNLSRRTQQTGTSAPFPPGYLVKDMGNHEKPQEHMENGLKTK